MEDYQSYTDQRLVEACLQANGLAWKELVSRFGGLVYSIPLRGCGFSPEDCDDVFQSVFGTVYEKLSELREPPKLRSWIVSITWRKCFDLQRSKEVIPEPSEIDEISVEEETPADVVAHEERKVSLRKSLEELSNLGAKAIIICRFCEGTSYKEISEALDIPLGSIGPILGRAFEDLRSILKRKGLEL